MSRKTTTSGVTLVELLISVAVGLIILTSAFGLTMSNRKLLAVDQERTSVNQNLRSALDIIGADVRVTGERLGSVGVPAIVVRNGNELILRRSVHDNVMPMCSGSNRYSNGMLISYWPGNEDSRYPGCSTDVARDKKRRTFNSSGEPVYEDGSDNVPDDIHYWQDYRIKNGNEVPAYIYNKTHRYGEFFTYTNEVPVSGQGIAIVRSGSWDKDYLMGEQNTIYLLEERRYRVNDEGVLELILNDKESDAQRVVNGLKEDEFKITAVLADGSTSENFGDAGGDWKDLRAIKVELESKSGRKLSSEFFPRNALSR